MQKMEISKVKKIAILSAVNIKHMSLISLYTTALERQGIPYDIVYMDKYGEEEKIGAQNIYRYENIIDHGWSRRKKIIRYFRFFWYTKKILEKNNYDRIIVWNDVAITMFGLYLARRWKGKYCLNIRDYNGEKKWFIYKIFKGAIEKSSFTTISSEGFKTFLPEHEYVSLYSYNDSLLSEMTPRSGKREKGKPIRISFVGNVRFFSVNKQLVDAFKNDERFELHYHGTNAETMEVYAKEVGARNVVCSGTFPISDTKQYLEETDIVNNVFGNGTYGVKTLTSIRLFHAAYLNLPIMVSSNTFMKEITDRFNIGFPVEELSRSTADQVYDWYSKIKFDKLQEECKRLLKEAEDANALFEKKLNEWLA